MHLTLSGNAYCAVLLLQVVLGESAMKCVRARCPGLNENSLWQVLKGVRNNLHTHFTPEKHGQVVQGGFADQHAVLR